MNGPGPAPLPALVAGLRRARLAAPRPDPGAGAGYRAGLAASTDAALVQLWDHAATRTGLDLRRGVALTAVGSLGRRDGGPLADLDLLLVHDGSLRAAALTALAEALWYPLWDAGLDLDHAVRSLEDCRRVAEADLPAAVGLLDVRAVAGDADLAARASAAVLADWRAAARRRLPELLENVTARAQRAGEVAYLIEPDLKEARGGLRDAVVVRALAASWLTDRPHGALDRAYAHLLDVRDALQAVTGRRSSVLRLAEQDDVARRLGLVGPDAVAGWDPSSAGRADAVRGRLAGADPADELLTSVAGAARVVAAALDTTVRQARRATARPRPRRPLLVRGRPQPPRLPVLAEGLAAHEGEVVLAGGADLGDPLLALRAAATAARTGLPLSPVTLASLATAATPAEPWPPAARALLTELLTAGAAQVAVWEALDLAGVVTRWIPEWAPIRNRPQRTAVHRFTVDRHQVQTVATLPATWTPADADAREDLLALAALLHDLGKHPGQRNHAAAGAVIAAPVLTRLGLPPADREVVLTLVREHLLLARLATTADLTDPAVTAAVTAAVGHRGDVLRLLHRLTEADARATGPQAWTPWRARLVQTLTARAHAALALP